MTRPKVAIGADHRGFALKEQARALLASEGVEVADKGSFTPDPADYPDAALAVAEAVSTKAADLGILACGTGNGMAIAANKVAGVRAALCLTPEMARLARQHNDANVLVLASDCTPERDSLEAIRAFLAASFEGGRHERRVGKIRNYEAGHLGTPR
jgi:ribose 5-phosphate isomerase B